MKDTPPPEASPSTHSEFTSANVFGVFFTLILCLLSQPVGSLLYCAGRPGRFRSLVLALWRLNPLACLCEALIIFITIGRTTWNTFQNRQSTNLSGWKTRLRRTAAALLLLRAQAWTKDGFLIVPRLFWAVKAEGYPPDRSMDYRELLATLQPPATAHDTPRQPERPGLWSQAARWRMGQSFDLSTDPSALPSPDNLSDGFKDLAQLLGPHASRSEIFIQVVAFVGTLASLVKITVSVLPWSVRLPAYFMILGWCAVQILLLLLHGGEPSETELKKTAHLARDIDRDILSGTYIASEWQGSWTRMAIIWLTPLPVAGYLATIMTNLMLSGDGPKSLRAVVMLFEIVFIPPTVLVLFTNALTMLLILGIIPNTTVIFAYFYFSTPGDELAAACYTMMGRFLNFVLLAIILAYPALMTPPAMVWGDKTGRWESVGVLLHVVISSVLFFALFHFYDAAETLKPEWLEWLG
ncbi:hypothetical protein QBC39DRAFT_363009 [Podospora conica]|nr:hypothetical protein QBC39DRAFT_363009 [Schizothecium conicum]